MQLRRGNKWIATRFISLCWSPDQSSGPDSDIPCLIIVTLGFYLERLWLGAQGLNEDMAVSWIITMIVMISNEMGDDSALI